MEVLMLKSLNQASGFTLVEMLLVMGLACFLLLKLASPSFAYRRQQQEITDMMRQIQDAISMARSSAVGQNVMVTFCRSRDGETCSGSWSEGSIIFTDYNADHEVNDEDQVIIRLPALLPAGTLSFNSFRNRQYLQLTPRGVTNFQNGNFKFCPDNGDMHLAAQLIVSFTARTRMAKDSDGDGVVENSQGRALDCS